MQRGELICYVCNRSGGLHLSEKLEIDDYYSLELEDMSLLSEIKFQNSGLTETVYASAKQMAVALRRIPFP